MCEGRAILPSVPYQKKHTMKYLIIFVGICLLSSCYSVSRVGNCKYYTPKNLSSKGRPHQLISF